MYNNQLQKDGFQILSKLGFSVSHSTVNTKLNAAKVQNENLMKSYRKTLEDSVAKSKPTSCVEADHLYATEHPVMEHSYAVSHADPLVDSTAPLGYRFNIDNLDFHIRVREMTQQHQNLSQHYTQLMTLVDRVPCEHLSDDQPVGDLLAVENSEFLPTADDNYALRKDMIHVVSNILVENIPSFKVFENIYPKHFLHTHSKEMAKKSTVVYISFVKQNFVD
jgi:hypothetical protein